MKWDCGETLGEKRERLAKPHKWFAWHPIHVADHDCRWLEFVERQVVWNIWGDKRTYYRDTPK